MFQKITTDTQHKGIPIEWHNKTGTYPRHCIESTHTPDIESLLQHIQNLNEFNADLLQNNTIHNLRQLQTLITNENPIIACHDGGALLSTRGSFGWVIADSDKIIASGGGITRGHPILSFCSEAYGRIALLTFLQEFIKYHKQNKNTLLTMYENQ